MTNGLTSQALFYPNRRIYEPKEKASISRGFEWRCFWSRSPFSSPEGCLAFWISILTHSISTMLFFFSKQYCPHSPTPTFLWTLKTLGQSKFLLNGWAIYKLAYTQHIEGDGKTKQRSGVGPVAYVTPSVYMVSVIDVYHSASLFIMATEVGKRWGEASNLTTEKSRLK